MNSALPVGIKLNNKLRLEIGVVFDLSQILKMCGTL
jgi:hypothetical protein